jgi:hypothetical protein
MAGLRHDPKQVRPQPGDPHGVQDDVPTTVAKSNCSTTIFCFRNSILIRSTLPDQSTDYNEIGTQVRVGEGLQEREIYRWRLSLAVLKETTKRKG